MLYLRLNKERRVDGKFFIDVHLSGFNMSSGYSTFHQVQSVTIHLVLFVF